MALGQARYAGNDVQNDLVGKVGFMYNSGNIKVYKGPKEPGTSPWFYLCKSWSWGEIVVNEGPNEYDPESPEDIELWAETQLESKNHGMKLMHVLGLGPAPPPPPD